MVVVSGIMARTGALETAADLKENYLSLAKQAEKLTKEIARISYKLFGHTKIDFLLVVRTI